MAQEKFITSHKFRVRRAKEELENSPEIRVSIWDREAYVETYLLEDIIRLYEYRLQKELTRTVASKYGESFRRHNIESFQAILSVVKQAYDICEANLSMSNYRLVWSSINEGALMRAAGSTKNLPALKALVVKLVKTLYEDTLIYLKNSQGLDEEEEILNEHDRNARLLEGLPSEEEYRAALAELEKVLPDVPSAKAKSNPTIA